MNNAKSAQRSVQSSTSNELEHGVDFPRKAAPKLRDALKSKEHERRPFLDYRRFVQDHYNGLPGALTAVSGLMTGHEALAGRLIRAGGFDVRGAKSILDAGCGNGRYTRLLLRDADADARIAAFDLAPRMLRRARARLKTPRVGYAAADLTRLPYANAAFDAVVCGWVLEHLPDPRVGLRELSRVLRAGGRLLLLATEDTFAGALCSRLWHCQTYNRRALRELCAACGLHWGRELSFSRLLARFRIGGIIAELHRA